MLGKGQIVVSEEKCRRSLIFPKVERITMPRKIDRKMPKEAYGCELPTSITKIFKNIPLHINRWLSKIHSVHTYVHKGFILVVSTVFHSETFIFQ